MTSRATAAVIAALLAVSVGLPARAATVPSGPAASADAYGVLVDTQLLTTHTPLRYGPASRATQDYPAGAAQPSTAQLSQAGPYPADGSLLNHVGALSSIAGANGLPNAVASAEAHDVSLLGVAPNSKVTADLVRAQANADCNTAPNGTGTTFANLKINGTPIDYTPQPNTVYNLASAVVVLNEQHPASDGRGIVVNAIHVLSTTSGDAAWRGDVIVGHAMSTVHCTNGEGSTGAANVIQLTKSATPTTVAPGGQVTYTASVKNTSPSACLVTEFIEHLNGAFEFVSTSGDFGSALDRAPAPRPGGGDDLVLGNGKSLASGATFTQTFVVRAKDLAADGIYYNNLEILCANIGDWVKGLDAPVRVTSGGPEAPKPQCSDGRDNDGDHKVDYPADPGCASPLDNDERNAAAPLPRTGGSSWVLWAGAALVGAALVTRRLRVTN